MKLTVTPSGRRKKPTTNHKHSSLLSLPFANSTNPSPEPTFETTGIQFCSPSQTLKRVGPVPPYRSWSRSPHRWSKLTHQHRYFFPPSSSLRYFSLSRTAKVHLFPFLTQLSRASCNGRVCATPGLESFQELTDAVHHHNAGRPKKERERSPLAMKVRIALFKERGTLKTNIYIYIYSPNLPSMLSGEAPFLQKRTQESEVL